MPSQPWTPNERDDYLQGQVHALTCLAQALIRTHPHREAVLAAFEEQMIKTEANTLALPLRDAHLQGLRAVQALLYPAGANPAEKR